jgi:glycosyltransferase involved in cell wall biosynthesis
MTNPPLVSVIIAVKNGERFLAQAIESILNQTRRPHEIVVVDGGSTDRSKEIAESYDLVRCIDQSSEGFAAAWNEGIAVARGDLIAILDSDDWWAPGKLEAQVKHFVDDTDTQYCVTRMRFVLEPGHEPPPGFKPELLDSDHIAYMPSALMVRRDVFDLIGDFQTGWKISSDIEWFARAKDIPLKLAVVPEVMLYKRVHDSNLSYLDARALRFNGEIAGLLKQSIDRQRARRSAGDVA